MLAYRAFPDANLKSYFVTVTKTEFGGIFTMAAVTASMVKQLREMTGAGMMDCKKALAETDGDMDSAVKFLREKGLAAIEKKAGRIAAEGVVKTLIQDNRAVIVEVNSETDFVAKNADFNTFVEKVAEQALDSDADSVETFLEESWAADTTMTVLQALSSEIAIIGENLKIRRFAKMEAENGFIASYIHMGGKIGVLVNMESDVVNDEIREMGRNVAMQAAAMKPAYMTRDEVDAAFIEKEKEILKTAAKNEKPDADDKIIDGMVNGRLKKELKEICLLDQDYFKAADGKQSVAAYIAEVAKKNGAHISLKGFVRYETGEGLEKKADDFAAEVAAQAGM